MGQDISISSPDGSFSGYLATPSSGSGPGIVVIQEIFGVNKVMRDICDDLANEGFVALSPDLFWRIEPNIQLTDQSQEEWNKAFELFGKFDGEAGVKDIQATISTLRNHDACTGKVGTVGYCLGGYLAYMSSAKTDTDASVGYYGVNIQEKLDEAANIKKPLILHVAEKDSFVPPEAQEAISNGLKGYALVTIHTYPGREHAFARVGGEHFHEADAKTANERTRSFFKQNLS